MTGLVSAGARTLAAQALGNDRVLVTGASGWLGRTALDLIDPLGLPTLALASRARIIRVGIARSTAAYGMTGKWPPSRRPSCWTARFSPGTELPTSRSTSTSRQTAP